MAKQLALEAERDISRSFGYRSVGNGHVSFKKDNVTSTLNVLNTRRFWTEQCNNTKSRYQSYALHSIYVYAMLAEAKRVLPAHYSGAIFHR